MKNGKTAAQGTGTEDKNTRAQLQGGVNVRNGHRKLETKIKK
jgi:hypothetical protein